MDMNMVSRSSEIWYGIHVVNRSKTLLTWYQTIISGTKRIYIYSICIVIKRQEIVQSAVKGIQRFINFPVIFHIKLQIFITLLLPYVVFRFIRKGVRCIGLFVIKVWNSSSNKRGTHDIAEKVTINTNNTKRGA